jgi:phosphomethylpyrimidine synthase
MLVMQCTSGPRVRRPSSTRIASSADVRTYAEENGLSSLEAIEAGMADKSAEFARMGNSVYLPVRAL